MNITTRRISKERSNKTRGQALGAGLSEDHLKKLLLDLVPGNRKWAEDGEVRSLRGAKPTDTESAEKALLLDQKAVQESFGADTQAAVPRLIWNLMQGTDGEQSDAVLATAIGVLRAMGPQNAIEGMLMAQMLMMHEQAARLMCISRQPDLPIDSICRVINTANSCAESFKEGMEALNRFRSGGKQQVIVSHVNIEPGGQAAFTVGGDVKGGGGGSDAER